MIPKYPKYSVSQAPWLEILPSHWNCKKIGSLFIERKTKVSDTDYPPLSVTKMGIMPQLEHAAKTSDGDNRKLVCAGDFVINSRSDRKGSCGVSELDGSVSLINLILKPRLQWNVRYVHYLLRSQPFSEEFYRNGRGIVADLWTTRYSEMKSILLPVPPREEQDQIVRFLDWKVSSINKLIRIKRQQIAQLEELKKAIVSRILTKGLNPNTKMKDSGVGWIGNIPDGWDVVRIKWLFNETDERNHQVDAELLSFSKKRGLIPFAEASDKAPSAGDLSNYKLLRKGQLLENRMQAWHGMFICADREGCVSPDYSVFNPSHTRPVNVKFYEYVFRCSIWVDQFANASRGIGDGFNRLYTPRFGAIFTINPGLEEQNQIVEYLDNATRKLNSLIESINKRIDVLKELKTRLIADAVTGRIDVRGIEIPEYELVEDAVDSNDEENASEEETEEQED